MKRNLSYPSVMQPPMLVRYRPEGYAVGINGRGRAEWKVAMALKETKLSEEPYAGAERVLMVFAADTCMKRSLRYLRRDVLTHNSTVASR